MFLLSLAVRRVVTAMPPTSQAGARRMHRSSTPALDVRPSSGTSFIVSGYFTTTTTITTTTTNNNKWSK